MPLILFTNKKNAVVVSPIADAILTTPANDSVALKSYVTIDNDVRTVSINDAASIAISSIGASSGKLYFEFTQTAYYAVVGLSVTNPRVYTSRTENNEDLFGVYLHSAGYNCNWTGCGYGAGLGFALGDTLGVAMDLNTNTITWYKISGTTVTVAGVSTSANCARLGTMPKPWHPFCGSKANSTIAAGNFNLYGPFKNLPAGYTAFSTSSPDTIPLDDFILSDNFASPSAYLVSPDIPLHGFNQQTTVSVTNCSYSILRNSVWSNYTTANGVINPGESIRFKAQASAVNGDVITATVNLGSLIKTFKITTISSTTSLLSAIAHASSITIGGAQVTASSTAAGWAGGRGDTAISSGKRYWEVTVNNINVYGMLGIIDAASTTVSMTNSSYLGDAYNKSVGLYVVDGNTTYNNNTANWTTVKAAVNNNSRFTSTTDVIGLGLDMTLGELHIFKNGVDQGVFIRGITTPVYPAYCIYKSGLTMTFNFGGSGFKYLPAGYTPV